VPRRGCGPALGGGHDQFAYRVFDGVVGVNVIRCQFVQQERFRGVLVPLFARNLDDQTLRGFNAMNAALKARVEAAAGNQPVVAA
jgi:hypothetical protein